MSTTAPVPTRPPEPETPCARIERQLQLLGELAEVGLEVARAIERQACGEPMGPREAGEVALAYARTSRAVRQTVLLQSKLIHDLKAETFAQAQTARLERRQRGAAAAPDASADDRPRPPVLEAAEGLEPLEDDDEFLDEPFDQAVARICRDLGLPTSRIASAAEIGSAFAEEGFAKEARPSGPGFKPAEARGAHGVGGPRRPSASDPDSS